MPQTRSDLRGPIAEDTPHFHWEEVRCNHCGQLPDELQAVINAARMMENVREILGGQPLKIHSWYRCPFWNRQVGGASNSQHIFGRAIDFSTKRTTPRKVQQILRPYLGKVVRGLGEYPGFTHVDNRPEKPARWRE